jgi:undecaprenyl-diphosphatase
VRTGIDDAVARWVAGHRSDVVTRAARALESADAALGFLAVVGVLAVCAAVWFGGWRPMVQVVGVLAVTSLMTGWLKPVIDRSRPPAELALTDATGPAMPSSHALITSSIVVAVVMADWWRSDSYRRAAVAVGGVGCLVIGAAMVYLGAHWLTDVLVGWAIGIGLTWGLMRIVRHLSAARQEPGGR